METKDYTKKEIDELIVRVGTLKLQLSCAYKELLKIQKERDIPKVFPPDSKNPLGYIDMKELREYDPSLYSWYVGNIKYFLKTLQETK